MANVAKLIISIILLASLSRLSFGTLLDIKQTAFADNIELLNGDSAEITHYYETYTPEEYAQCQELEERMWQVEKVAGCSLLCMSGFQSQTIYGFIAGAIFGVLAINGLNELAYRW